MMVISTNTVAALTLATLISLGQWFGDGMTRFEKKDYKAAAALFTKVIESKSNYNPDKLSALYMRSQCFMKLKLKEDATGDLSMLLQSDPAEELFKLAAADHKKLTGKDWQGDRSTPEATWKTFMKAIKKRDVAAVQRCLSGSISAELGMALAQPEFFAEIAEEIGPLVTVAYNNDKSRAVIVFQEGKDPTDTEELVMTRVKSTWTISDEYRSRNAAEFGRAKPPSNTPPAPVAVSEDDAKTIHALIAQLGAPSFRDRKSAYAELKAMSEKARGELQKALINPDPEISTAAKKLLEEL